MKYWKPRLSKQSDKYEVRLNRLRLELGLFGARVRGNETMAIEIAAKPESSNPTSRFALPFYPKSKRRCLYTTDRKTIRKSPTLSWDARDLQDFHVVLKDDSAVCDVAFHVLYEERSEGKPSAKREVVGKVSMDLTMAELLDKKQAKTKSGCQLRRRLPIELRINGLAIEATLSVSGSFLKLNSSHDSRKTPENSVSSEKKQNERKIDEPSASESEDYRWFDSDDSSKSFTSTSTTSSGSSLNALLSKVKPKKKFETDNCLDTSQRNGIKGFNFRATTTRKPEALNTKPDKGWQRKELMSRDGRAKLNTSVFFASFDQRSEQASGESACAALVTFVAHWLHSNQDMPTKPEFDNLITEGSSEWRRLCERDDASSKLFPDKHFDLDTVIEANLRPLFVVREKSYTGFFSPDKFESLKGAMSFDEIWHEISRDVVDYEPRIYIVSWNDHFFVLKLEADAYYIIDSLGERLFEGCKEAFILRFDDSSSMYEKAEKAARRNDSSGGGGSFKSEKENLKLVCSGKDCCREFIKRFLAALPLKYLEEEEKKGAISSPYLHRRLQIDFHYSSSLSTSSTATSLFKWGFRKPQSYQ
ncbi:LOW QUALITY PROTEIN: uncharacterized protein LOC129302972 [Prosopis cineraria]|uniref:LOW QUALITY PROTEIN: uncharacterized protein LOC129302972 n=1 Tax=Prosopis cineraria TaxID=364024 RepID=UPI00240F88A4|nr:LOW QUALITY PROTEIN: uncharacterized protein LOC129302972 [Prosopis cineraria]